MGEADRADWRAVVESCESVSADLSRLVREVVDGIRREPPEYRVVDRTSTTAA
jgi:chromosome condensin MukBEF complex kleisin-like MukF subunit